MILFSGPRCCQKLETVAQWKTTLVLIRGSVPPYGQFTYDSSSTLLVVFEKEIAAACAEQLSNVPTSSFHLAVYSCPCLVTFIASSEFSVLR